MNRVALLAIGTVGLMSCYADAQPTYNHVEEEKTLYVDVPEGVTSDFDVAEYGGLLTENTITNLVKHGHGGTLSLGSSDFSAYTGRFTFMTGVVTFAAANALGADAEGADVRVMSGATLECVAQKVLVGSTLRKKLMVYEGFGMDGKGAFHSTVGQTSSAFGMNVELAGDTLFLSDVSFQLNYNTQINMNGHTLHYKTVNGGNNSTMNGLNLLNPGNIVNENGNAFIKDGVAWRGGKENTITVNGLRSGLYNIPVASDMLWTLILSENTKDFWIGENTGVDWLNAKRNCWAGPVRIDAPKLNVFASAQGTDATTGEKGCGVSFAGKISGGGINLIGNIDGGSPARENTHMHLSHSENDFTNGVSVSLATLHVWNNGALPADGAALAITNGTVLFENMRTMYELPSIKAYGTGLVANALGICPKIEKSGDGVFESRSLICASTLDVKGGTFKMSAMEGDVYRNPMAGMIGGVLVDAAVDELVNYRYAIPGLHSEVFTNVVELSASPFHENGHSWWDVVDKESMRVIVYDGYLWNHAPTNETWTFAGACATHYALAINGEPVIYWTKGNGRLSVASNCVVKTGANRIQIRVYGSGGGQGPIEVNETMTIDGTTYTSDVYPWGKRGFPYFDRLGRRSSNPDDYQKLEDPGDGSLLTWALPGDDLPEYVPGTSLPTDRGKDFSSRLFTAMNFASNTVFDCNFATQIVTTLSGRPTIRNCGCFVVEGDWTVAGDELPSGYPMATDGKLVFSDGASLAVMEGAVRFDADSGLKVLATAAEGIEGMPVAADPIRWRISKSSDSKTLYVEYRPKGTVMILR